MGQFDSCSLEQLTVAGECPAWVTEESLATMQSGYLLEGETPRGMYQRVANSVAGYLNRPDLAEKFYTYIDNGWLCLASPVASNSGTPRGLPVSCFSNYLGDSIDSIFKGVHEAAMLTKMGGGLGICLDGLRGRGSEIKGNGKSDGIIPWLKVMEATLQSVSQGGVRRGSGAQYLSVRSPDIEEFIDVRKNNGDLSRRCLSNNFHHAINITDEFMQSAMNGGKDEELWIKILQTRFETGEPYMCWIDTINKANPECYKQLGLTVKSSNLCSEIQLFSDEEHTFVCVLSSINLARYDEWKDTDLVETAIWFLDGVMEEFIQKASDMPGFEKAVRSAKKGRALGLGVLGWHTLLQKKRIPFESFEAMQLNAEIFKGMREKADKATADLSEAYGEVEWTKGHNRRNTHLEAIAPTFSNAILSGGVSQGIEPIIANYFAQKSAKGTFIRKNRELEALLEGIGRNTFDVWEQINKDQGSVRNLSFLTVDEKEVFATAREINQFAIVRQAAQRQQWIDQGQSVNLFFTSSSSLDNEQRKKLGNYVHEVHYEAYRLGLKTLYYVRPTSILQGQAVYASDDTCKSCEG